MEWPGSLRVDKACGGHRVPSSASLNSHPSLTTKTKWQATQTVHFKLSKDTKPPSRQPEDDRGRKAPGCLDTGGRLPSVRANGPYDSKSL